MPVPPSKRAIPTVADFLNARLRADADIAAYVSDRIRLGTPEDIDYPFICFKKFSGESVVSHQGKSGLGCPVWEVQVADYDAGAVDNISELVRINLQSFTGTAGGVSVSNCHKLPVEEDHFDNDQKVHTRRMLFRVWYAEVTA
jgi:hypothetical protein